MATPQRPLRSRAAGSGMSTDDLEKRLLRAAETDEDLQDFKDVLLLEAADALAEYAGELAFAQKLLQDNGWYEAVGKSASQAARIAELERELAAVSAAASSQPDETDPAQP